MTFIFAMLIMLGSSTSLNAGAELSERPEMLGQFRNTYYYVVIEADYAQYPTDTVLRSMKGNVIAEVSSRFKKALDIEGTGKLINGRIVNYAGRVDKEVRYLFTDAPWGLGVGTCELVPFHTIAVDPSQIPLGSTVKIEETVGMVLPDGSLHDGIWRADDVGGAIKKDRIDLFTGTGRDGSTTLSKAGIYHLKPLTLRMIEPPALDSCVHQKLLDEEL